MNNISPLRNSDKSLKQDGNSLKPSPFSNLSEDSVKKKNKAKISQKAF